MSTGGGSHLTQQYSVQKTFDKVFTTRVYQGSQGAIESLIGGYSVGEPHGSDGVTTAVSLRRLNGGVCEATIQSAVYIKKALYGCDFHQLSKPTITFRFPGENDSIVNERAHRIRGWEALRDANRMPEYLDFKFIKYDDANNEIGTGYLSGGDSGCGANTLAIAQKIMRGQEVYSVYYPVLTCTRTSFDGFGNFDDIGHQCSPGGAGGGWKAHGPTSTLTSITGTKTYWVKTADNVTTNSDGSVTRREQWTGMDDVDADFYPKQGW